MPHILSPIIKTNFPGMWSEGDCYIQKTIYSIAGGKLPPVNYSEHVFKPHSLTHAEAPLHVEENGKDISNFFKDSSFFYGGCVVIRLQGDNYKKIEDKKELYHWEVTVDEIKLSLARALRGVKFPGKILVTTDVYRTNTEGYHDPNYVLTLSEEAAKYICELEGFNLYGTSWKSSDFKPGSNERPIHKILFNKAIIMELLDLKNVSEGVFFFVGVPIPLQGASESLVSPILFKYDEIV